MLYSPLPPFSPRIVCVWPDFVQIKAELSKYLDTPEDKERKKKIYKVF